VKPLRGDYDVLTGAEKLVESDEEYTFGDLRDDASDFTALSILNGAIKADDENEEIYLHEDSFDYVLEMESARRGIESRPSGLEMGVVGGSALGLAGSTWKVLEEGSPEYLATGALSFLAGRSALKRLGAIQKAKVANDEAGKKLEIAPYLESYELKTIGDEEVQEILDQQRRRNEADIEAYTADELEDMDMEELEQVDGMFEEDQ